ncbi:MauE/DoxX family redox-associated membrane protein [Mucilaginibacter terrae]|uniref:Oxidoreductase n=1 Tax=Mucilaginibacter terrae TaxID=1955052 RepID=A0ABU3GQN4_9SPHI|nr:MauE/DoxX family redox-associated membrane protein [Mucilaginibacter terrae]MDT3401257.1 putative oxidoreductase [Mucilaginibacter terrae]
MVKDKKSWREVIISLTYGFLIILWLYAALSKLADFAQFKREMGKQVFPEIISQVLIYIIPGFELLTVLLLMISRTFMLGLYASLSLLSVFTVYIGMGVTHLFPKVPCSCGGILGKMGWTSHLFFNLFFLALTITTILIQKKGGQAIQSESNKN